MNRADLDKQIANAAARAAVAARNGDDDAWREWSDTATRLLDQRDASGHGAVRQRRGVRTGSGTGCAPVSFYARPAS